jgi:Lrp/AsnC family leucine-responsive transcriptional regulator
MASPDDTDRMILSTLREDSRIQFSELGKKVHLSAPAVFARVKKLEAAGIIKRFSVELDPAKLDAGMCAFIRIVLKGVSTAQTIEKLKKRREIEEAHHVAGEDCLILKVRTKGSLELNELLENIKTVPGIERTITSVVLRSEFDRGFQP